MFSDHCVISKCRAVSPWGHCAWLGAALAVLLVGWLLDVKGDGRVGPRGRPEFVLPELCAAKRFFALPCPGCGLTRSVIHLMHGEVRASLAMNPAGVLIVAALAAQIPLRLVALSRGRCGLLESRVLLYGTLWGVFAVLLAQFASALIRGVSS